MKLALEAQYPTIMILLFKFSGDFLSLKSNPESENSSSILGTLTTTVKLLQDYLSTCKEEIYSNTSHSDIEALHKDQSTDVGLNLPIPETILNINTSVIERLVLCTEMFSICVLLVCRLKSVVSEVKMNAQRKKRRKKGKQATTLSLPTWVADYHASVASFSDIGGQLVSGVSRIKTDVETSMLDVGKLKLDNGTEQGSDSQTEHEKPEHEKAENIANSTNTVNDGIYKRITNNALDSYIVSCKQLLFVLEGRMKNLKEAAKV
uniref:Uncharacterized protein n=1 Tax=Ciona savignyi TaxID=51511 RepID=H2YMS2_CIOSA